MIRVFQNISNNMHDCFDQIDKAASSHAQKNETNEY
jgi:hypothetical protein